MKEQIREEPTIVAAAERQMQAWAMDQAVKDRTVDLQDAAEVAAGIQPYVTISREAGAGGSLVAEAVGKRLGWEVLDRNLLDRVADRYHLSRPMLEAVDEARTCWVHDVLGAWIDRKIIPTEKYVVHLGHVVLSMARHASLVIVGRGAQFLLPPDRGLTVRVIASQKYRIRQLIDRENLKESAARRKVNDLDIGRREFARRYFHHDIDDPHQYDMVLNVERLGIERVAEMIAAEVQR